MARQPAQPKYQKSVYYTVDDWNLINKAAVADGVSVTQFIVKASVAEAEYVLSEVKDDDQNGV